MLVASTALIAFGLLIGVLRLPAPFLVIPSLFVLLADIILRRNVSPSTVLEIFVLLTALQAGYLVSLTVETPMRQLKLFGIALMLAAGAFVLTMLKNPPQSIAFDPTRPPEPQTKVTIPTGLP